MNPDTTKEQAMDYASHPQEADIFASQVEEYGIAQNPTSIGDFMEACEIDRSFLAPVLGILGIAAR